MPTKTFNRILTAIEDEVQEIVDEARADQDTKSIRAYHNEILRYFGELFPTCSTEGKKALVKILEVINWNDRKDEKAYSGAMKFGCGGEDYKLYL